MSWSATERDEYFMRHALEIAQHAHRLGEVPVGAVLVRGDEIIATGFNQPIGLHDPSAHAEIVTLRAAGNLLQNYRLPGCELFVTLEPCLMCAGAIMHARLERVVYGASDYKTGVAGSVLDIFANKTLNHHVQCHGEVLAEEAKALLQIFFKERRANS